MRCRAEADIFASRVSYRALRRNLSVPLDHQLGIDESVASIDVFG